MADDKKIIFSMVGVSKSFQNNKQVLKDIYLSFFYGAKIGIIGLNGSGKSTLMKIIAGLEKNYQGEVVFSPGYSVGYLAQEPHLDDTKTVKEVVMEGVQNVVDTLAEYEEINNKFGLPEYYEDPEKMDALFARQAELQDIIDATDAWNLDSKLERAMLRAGIASCSEMQMLVSDSRFPDEVECTLDFEYESLFELNRLCYACSGFKEQDFKKLGAVCQMAKPACAANIRQLAENLDQFDFAPNVHTPEELGKYMIQQSGHYEYDENLEDFYNYGDYGVKRILQDDGVFVDRGYVSYHGTLTLEELMRDDPAESHQQEQEAKMEDMTW